MVTTKPNKKRVEMVLPVSPKVGLCNNCPMLNFSDVSRVVMINRYNQLTWGVQIFHYLTNMGQHFQPKTYWKMPLINKQPHAILKFWSINIPLVQSKWQYSVRFGGPNFDSICTKCMWVTLYHSAGSFFNYIANYLMSLSFFGFFCSAILKLTLLVLKVLRCGILTLSRELTNLFFTDIAFGACHTYSHRRRSPRNTRSEKRGRAIWGPHDPGWRLFFNIIFLEINIKNNEGVLAGEPPTFLATLFVMANFDKFNFISEIGELNCRNSSY